MLQKIAVVHQVQVIEKLILLLVQAADQQLLGAQVLMNLTVAQGAQALVMAQN